MTAHISHIFLDMDGVLSDFATAALRVHGRQDLLATWPSGERDFAKVLGISKGEFWRAIDAQGSAFWAEIEPYPWLDELIDFVRATAPFSILTSPALSPSCLEGKVLWLRKHFAKVEGRSFNDYLIGYQKHLLACPGRVLIDDAEANVDAFQLAGGVAILFPQVWNQGHDVIDPLAHVKSRLAALTAP